jgi:hypothetical protein
LITNKQENLHPNLSKIYKNFSENVRDIKNIIFYGPSGTGKYTQMLKFLKKFSPSSLKYDKKISIQFNKQTFVFKISDIHYEIDMSMLGVNSKLLWHELYQQIVDIVSVKADKVGFIVCKLFHEIHFELLDNFYSYMQKTNEQHLAQFSETKCKTIDLKFIIITEEISFIPDNILNCCQVIHVARPTKTLYNKCIQKHNFNEFSLMGTILNVNNKLENITNIKNLYSQQEIKILLPHKNICDKLLKFILEFTPFPKVQLSTPDDAFVSLNTKPHKSKIDTFRFLELREYIYDILVYNLNMYHCIEYIITTLIQQKKIHKEKLPKLLIEIYSFFRYYNNNYRPIYHLEKIICSIILALQV